MELQIDNHIISEPIISILNQVKYRCNGEFLKHINDKGNNILITCPFHASGQEKHPACNVYNRNDDPKLELGYYRCFACGAQGHLYDLVAYCLNLTKPEAKEWLKDNFGALALGNNRKLLPKIELNTKKTYIDESILHDYDYYHPYMWERKLSKNVVDLFRVGYNKSTNSLTFPIYDEKDNLVMVTERNIYTKHFYIPEGIEKPVYLLNHIIKNNINTVTVCESQINALTCWSLGIPAIALIGTGSTEQYKILNKSPIRHYYLAFDGDKAGQLGVQRFLNNIRKDVLVDVLKIPHGKDINDLSKLDIKNLYNTVDFIQ